MSVSTLVLVGVLMCCGHPQCVSYGAPFPSAGVSSVCPAPEGALYTCCTAARREALAAAAGDDVRALEALGTPAALLCAEMVASVACAECSTYAAHIFGADSVGGSIAGVARLCGPFCHAMYGNCSQAVREAQEVPAAGVVVLSAALRERFDPAGTASTFCSARAPEDSDADYCFPDVLALDAAGIADDVGADTEDRCYCLEETVVTRNALVLTHAADSSGRLFYAEQRGVVYVMAGGGAHGPPDVFLDIRDRVDVAEDRLTERGLLGLAFHPDFALNVSVTYAAAMA